MYKFFVTIFMAAIILLWISDTFAQRAGEFDPPGGAQYYTMPETIDQAVNTEIYEQSIQSDYSGYGDMSYEDYEAYEDYKICQAWKMMLFPWTIGLSLLYDCT